VAEILNKRAAREYYLAQRNHYAAKIFSDEGQHNGPYWKASGSEPKSPIGPCWRSLRQMYPTADAV
jgi:hypothetical protein